MPENHGTVYPFGERIQHIWKQKQGCAPFGRGSRSPKRPQITVRTKASSVIVMPADFGEGVREFAHLIERTWHQDKFNRLADEWKRETYHLSKIKDKVAHLAYQKIIGMGPAAIPFILADLAEKGPNHWFLALHAITEENPVPKDQPGNIVVMTEAWLKWGREKGYLKDFLNITSETSPTSRTT
jgi:hypothetical protein